MLDYLPMNHRDMKKRGWEQLDIILVSGDAYVDHPAWAAALLGRFLEKCGYRVGIIAQPDWRNTDDFQVMGEPRLFFGVSAGNLDTMVSHYTADKKKRREDVYSPGGQAGLRPDRATIVYTNRLREVYPGVPIIIGGVEASLRRWTHYDYWTDRVRRSILVDSKADLLIYGMGEYPLLQTAQALDLGGDIHSLHHVRSTCYMASQPPQASLVLPGYDEVSESRNAFSRSTGLIQRHRNPYQNQILAQQHGDRWVVANPPALPLTTMQMDNIYDAFFHRQAHPVYKSLGGVPALPPVQFSLLTHRGCFGGCSFCSIGTHQGNFIQNRSISSLLKEAHGFVDHPDFRGSIPDVGAPSANMYGMGGKDSSQCRQCRRLSCLHPGVCTNLNSNPQASLRLWRKLRTLPGINNIRVASGVRYDLISEDASGRYLEDLCRYHVGGQLKIAPEHISKPVTDLMGKPGRTAYERFSRAFHKMNQKLGKEQYLVPYFISAHPGCSLENSVELAEYIRDNLRVQPEQVQNFTPIPMTLSTSMYYTGVHPLTGKPVYIPRSTWERKAQRALLQYQSSPGELVREALVKCNRTDLIGRSSVHLVGGLESGNGNPGKKTRKNPARRKNHRKKGRS